MLRYEMVGVLTVVEELSVTAFAASSSAVWQAAFGDQAALGVQHNNVAFGLEARAAYEFLHTVPIVVGLVVFRQRNHHPAGPHPILFGLDPVYFPLRRFSG